MNDNDSSSLFNYIAKNWVQIIKFSSIGLVNFLVDMGVYFFMSRLIGFGQIVSQVAAYSSGVANSFIMNKRFTFRNNENKKVHTELIKFIILNLLSLLITLMMMSLLKNYTSFNEFVIKLLATLTGQVFKFTGYKGWVFNQNPALLYCSNTFKTVFIKHI